MTNDMMVQQQKEQKEQKVAFSMKMGSAGFQKVVLNTLQDPKRAAKFTAAITSAVSNQPDLQACDASTILSGALLGESLNLSPSPQLGQYYLVPFKDRKRGRTVATFILGYKGYVQLALRSGYYKRLNVFEIKEGELISWNPLTEELELSIIEDDAERVSKRTIGYAASFEYKNGFQKTIYWSKDKMEAHALQYSEGYKAKTGYAFWEKDFDSMAKKTMLRQLISKWGIMSTELETALRNDDFVVTNDGNGYFEPGQATVEPTPQQNEAFEADFEEVPKEPEQEGASADTEQVTFDEL